jgi:hypothetical protein
LRKLLGTNEDFIIQLVQARGDLKQFMDETRGGFIIQLVQVRGDSKFCMNETRGGFIIQLVQVRGDLKFLLMRLEEVSIFNWFRLEEI